MHLYCIVRANHTRLTEWLYHLESVRYPWTTPDGKKVLMPITARPVQLVEIAFPEEQLTDVLATVQPYQYNSQMSHVTTALRMLMRLNPIQKAVMPNDKIYRGLVEVYGIGTRKDGRRPDGTEIL